MRLIDADELRKTMYHEAFETDTDMQKWDSGCWIRYKMFENALDNAPTIEAEPVRHGHWDIFYNDNIPYTLKCSECGQLTIVATKFCPSCGCKMDLNEVNNEFN